MRSGCALPALLVVPLLVLTGCQPGGTESSGSAPAPVVTAAQPAPSPTDQPKSAMPATDGGPMLWPTSTIRIVHLDGWTTDRLRHGFVDVRGELVVPPRYDWYEYCRDEAGRASLVLAGSGERQIDILDLTGRVTGQLPGRAARCIGDTHAEYQTEVSEAGPAGVGSGLFDLRAGEVVIEARPGRVVTMLDRRTVNVHRTGDEYFLDLVTGERTPHPGFLAGYLDPASDPALIPASDVYLDDYQERTEPPRLGYLDRQGRWALEPVFARAEPFHAGYAVVGDGSKDHFIDTGFSRVGGDWDWVTHVGWGYLAELRDGPRTGVLGLDLRVLVEPTEGQVDCGWGTSDACGIHPPPPGSPKALLLPEGILADLPPGYGTVLNRRLFSDAAEGSPATRILDTETNTTFALARPGLGCVVEGSWLSCEPAQTGAPPSVYRITGEPTVFREVTVIEDAVAGADSGYYWATAGSQQGFVDRTGDWLYRENRYTTLED